MNKTITWSLSLERVGWEVRRALYSFRKSPALAVLLMQAPVLAFVGLKGAGALYADMLGILIAIILLSWFFTSVVHGNRLILTFSLLLLTIGTMLQCIFLKEAMLKNPEKYAQGSPTLSLQIQYLTGFTAAVLVSVIYYKWDRISTMQVTRILFLLSTGLSLFTILFARSVGGVRNWIRIGSLSVQTTEITKLLYVFLTAGLLGTREEFSRERVTAFYGVSLVTALFLVVQGEYGTLLLLLVEFFAMLFLFVPDIRTFAGTAGLFGVLVFLIVRAGMTLSKLSEIYGWIKTNPVTGMILKGYSKIANRFIYWRHPEKDPLGQGYQLIKARESIVLGGWLGTGSVTDLPVKTSDLVYPALIQRCGMVFALLVFLIFILMWLEGMKLSVRKRDRYHQTLAAGLVILLFAQAVIIIAGSTGLCPLTGITLPFISSGGSSLLISFTMVGLLITISGNVGWKGTGNEEAEEFLKEGTGPAKCRDHLRRLYDAGPGAVLRAGGRRLRRGRPAEGKGETEGL